MPRSSAVLRRLQELGPRLDCRAGGRGASGRRREAGSRIRVASCLARITCLRSSDSKRCSCESACVAPGIELDADAVRLLLLDHLTDQLDGLARDVRGAHQDEFSSLERDDVDVGGVISVLRCAGFGVDDGILGVDGECSPAIGFEENPVGDHDLRRLGRPDRRA